MSASRLGVKQIIPDVLVRDYSGNLDGYIRSIKESMYREMGTRLVEELVSSNTPTVVRLSMLENPRMEWDMGSEVALIADLAPVEVMQVRMMELPPFEFIAPWKEKTVEWQCSYCGQVNLVDEHLECRKCGAPRKVLR